MQWPESAQNPPVAPYLAHNTALWSSQMLSLCPCLLLPLSSPATPTCVLFLGQSKHPSLRVFALSVPSA